MPEPTPGAAPHESLFTTTRLTARRLGPGDEEALQRVFEQAGDYFRPITGRADPEPDAARREIQQSGQAPGRAVALLQRHDGEAVGALGWWEAHPEPEVALLGMLMVAEGARGAGLAREAVEGLETWLRARGIRTLRTGVGAHATAHHQLLRALGFESLEQRTHVSLDAGRLMIALFAKPLAEPGDAPAPS